MLNVTLKQMQYVEAAGRLGSIAKAAKEIGISESSISAAIDSLEQQLAFDMFVRTPAKGIQPTPAGISAMQIIHDFLEQQKHFETELTSVGGSEGGKLRIACFVTAAGSFVAPILSEFKAKHPKVEIMWDCQLEEVGGDENPLGVTGAKIKNVKTGEIVDVATHGVFIAIGHAPSTELFVGKVDMKDNGYILTAPDSTATNIPGVFAAGDVTDEIYRQAVTAAGMGCMAALEAEKWLDEEAALNEAVAAE